MATQLQEIGRSLVSKWGRPARMIAVAVLALVLLIPLGMVESVVRDRYQTYRGVVEDIAGSWSGEQLVAGPILVVPYTEEVEVRDQFVTPTGEKKVVTRWESCRRRAVILPDELKIYGSLAPEMRHRGIYDVQVYEADLLVSGEFRGLRAAVESISSVERLEEIEWSKAVVAFGLSDPRGIVRVDGLRFNGTAVQPRPGTTLAEMLPRGFHTQVGEVITDSLAFELPILTRGSASLRFLPLGELTNVTLRSEWPHPSFIGDVLPAERKVTDDGFSADWSIPLLNRSYPQVWTAGGSFAIDEIEAGVRLFEPVALYDLVTRAVKYGLLFIVLTFLTLGLIELVIDVRLSLVQFLLIGVALALFFLILVALAEHIGFGTAYLLASATVVVTNTLYCAAILSRWSTAGVVGAVLAAIYGILFMILEAEDFALLGGTILLVAALMVTMYFTRQIHRPDNPLESPQTAES